MDPTAQESARTDGKLVKEAKRKKWQLKQDRKRKLQRMDQNRMDWFQSNQHFATFISTDDLKRAHHDVMTNPNHDNTVATLLRYYFDIQDGSRQVFDGSQLFIAEGTETVRLLVQQSRQWSESSSTSLPPPIQTLEPIRILSIFVKPSVFFEDPVHLQRDVEAVLGKRTYQPIREVNEEVKEKSTHANSNPQFRVLVGEESIMSSIAGFNISRGALACGIVPTHRTEDWFRGYLDEMWERSRTTHRPFRLLALDGISDTANLGSMIRTASAFGLVAVVLSMDCCDAWYRRSVRVSMGHVFRIPCIRVSNLAQFVLDLGKAFGTTTTAAVPPMMITTYAAVIDPAADVILDHLPLNSVPRSWCCIMGSEATGISPAVREACHYSIRIDMESGVDSLSVPIATGILLHGLKAREVLTVN